MLSKSHDLSNNVPTSYSYTRNTLTHTHVYWSPQSLTLLSDYFSLFSSPPSFTVSPPASPVSPPLLEQMALFPIVNQTSLNIIKGSPESPQRRPPPSLRPNVSPHVLIRTLPHPASPLSLTFITFTVNLILSHSIFFSCIVSDVTFFPVSLSQP